MVLLASWARALARASVGGRTLTTHIPALSRILWLSNRGGGALRRPQRGFSTAESDGDGEEEGETSPPEGVGTTGLHPGIIVDTGENALVSPARQVPNIVMAVPVHKRVHFPSMIATFLAVDEAFLQVMQRLKDRGQSRLGFFLAKGKDHSSIISVEKDLEKVLDADKTEAGPTVVTDINDIHPVGSLGQVLRMQPGKTGHNAIFAFSQRIGIVDVVKAPDAPTLVVQIERLMDEPYDRGDRVVKAYVQEILATIKDIISYNPFFRETLQTFLETIDIANPSELADVAAAVAQYAEPQQQQEILETFNVPDRLEKTLVLLKKELEAVKVQRDISKQLEEKISSNQRKYYLMEQLKTIKKELGLEKDEKETLLNKFKERIASLTIPSDVQQTMEEEMAKLGTLEPTSSEFGVTRNYVEWLTCLPWGKYSKDVLNIENAHKILEHDHHGLKDIKERILEFIAVGRLRGTVHGKILCFVGPPGTGKTSFGRSIAKALGREFFRFSVGGVSDVAEIKGHRRTYVGAMPGKLIQCLKQVKTSNPVILIDEVDKMGRGYQGDPASALLEVLDPEQNKGFLDHYLDVPFDLSKVLFVCTANTLDTIPQPLLDRMEVLRLTGYVLEEKVAITKRYLVPLARKETGLKALHAELRDSAIRDLVQYYCREAGVRNLQKHVEKVFRKVAYKVATGHETKISINSGNLKEFVGQRVFTSDRFYDRTPKGVAMGLAWTPMGGATLYIESAVVSQHGPGLRVTGHMGEVMKESTDVAYSFAKAFLLEMAPQSRFFESATLHIHIPEGATPKDGPSAGVTIVTSLLSLALGRPVAHNLAMTGELTLTGRVLPIGGVKEKTIAAKRSGVKILCFPTENKKDFEELPDYIRAGLEVHFVSTYRDVYNVSLGEEMSHEKEPGRRKIGKAATMHTAESVESVEQGMH